MGGGRGEGVGGRRGGGGVKEGGGKGERSDVGCAGTKCCLRLHNVHTLHSYPQRANTSCPLAAC